MTLTAEELETIRCHVEDCYLEVEFKLSKSNLRGGNWGSMDEANELLLYTYLLRDLQESCKQPLDNTYTSILTNKDILSIHNKALMLRAKINRI